MVKRGAPFRATRVGCTFLNMISDMAAREVKRTATMIIMTPTGTFLFRQVRAEIHPLWRRTRKFDTVGRLDSEFRRTQRRFRINVGPPHLVPQLVMPIHWIT